MASVTAAQQALSTDVAGLTVENNPNLAAPGSPMSSASSVFDGSNFSDLSIDDDFEFVNSYSEDEDVRSIWSERDEDTTPSASYLNKAARQRTITSTSSENGLKPSPSKMSFSFPDPEDDDVWVHPQAPSHDLGLEAVAQTPTIPSAVTSEGEEEECVNVGLNESCTSMESIADTEEEAPVAHRNVVPGDGWDGMPETVSGWPPLDQRLFYLAHLEKFYNSVAGCRTCQEKVNLAAHYCLLQHITDPELVECSCDQCRSLGHWYIFPSGQKRICSPLSGAFQPHPDRESGYVQRSQCHWSAGRCSSSCRFADSADRIFTTIITPDTTAQEYGFDHYRDKTVSEVCIVSQTKYFFRFYFQALVQQKPQREDQTFADFSSWTNLGRSTDCSYHLAQY